MKLIFSRVEVTVTFPPELSRYLEEGETFVID